MLIYSNDHLRSPRVSDQAWRVADQKPLANEDVEGDAEGIKTPGCITIYLFAVLHNIYRELFALVLLSSISPSLPADRRI